MMFLRQNLSKYKTFGYSWHLTTFSSVKGVGAFLREGAFTRINTVGTFVTNTIANVNFVKQIKKKKKKKHVSALAI